MTKYLNSSAYVITVSCFFFFLFLAFVLRRRFLFCVKLFHYCWIGFFVAQRRWYAEAIHSGCGRIAFDAFSLFALYAIEFSNNKRTREKLLMIILFTSIYARRNHADNGHNGWLFLHFIVRFKWN